MTFMQAFKVWWSYSWRASILVIPLSCIMTVWSLWGFIQIMVDTVRSGRSLSDVSVDQLMRAGSGSGIIAILSLVVIGAAQVFAMHWTLNSRWADFRVKAVPPDTEVANGPAAGGSGRSAGG